MINIKKCSRDFVLVGARHAKTCILKYFYEKSTLKLLSRNDGMSVCEIKCHHKI